MGKPSMFSKDYNKIMKKRKKVRMVSSLVGGILIATIVIIFTSDVWDSQLVSRIDNAEKEQFKDVASNGKEKRIEENTIKEDTKEELLEVKFNINGEEIIFDYEKIDDKLAFEKISDKSQFIEHSFNSKKESVLLIDKNQNMYLAKINGEVIDITLKEYVSTKGKIFIKDEVLEVYENYIWSEAPKFIDDERIAYISNVPYFGYDIDKYVTIYDIKTNEHFTMLNLKGSEINFMEKSENGLEVNIDGNINYIK